MSERTRGGSKWFGSGVPFRIAARPFQNKLLDRCHRDGYIANMKHIDFGQALLRLPLAARLGKAVPVWMLLASALAPLPAQQLFVNAASGMDTNPGTREQPLRSVTEAARRINDDTTSKSSEVIVAPGLYLLSQTALFKNSKAYTAKDRLIIRAEVLPDDPAWHPQQMPTVVTAVPLVADEA